MVLHCGLYLFRWGHVQCACTIHGSDCVSKLISHDIYDMLLWQGLVMLRSLRIDLILNLSSFINWHSFPATVSTRSEPELLAPLHSQKGGGVSSHTIAIRHCLSVLATTSYSIYDRRLSTPTRSTRKRVDFDGLLLVACGVAWLSQATHRIAIFSVQSSSFIVSPGDTPRQLTPAWPP